jgi:hypothetical protein
MSWPRVIKSAGYRGGRGLVPRRPASPKYGGDARKRISFRRGNETGPYTVIDDILADPLQSIVTAEEVIIKSLLPQAAVLAAPPGGSRAQTLESTHELDDRRRG